MNPSSTAPRRSGRSGWPGPGVVEEALVGDEQHACHEGDASHGPRSRDSPFGRVGPMGSGLDRVVANGVRWGGGRIRLGPWHGDARLGYLAPVGRRTGRPASAT